MTKLFVSASEMEDWYLCQRKWAGIHIHKIHKPPTASTSTGSAVHKVLETYQKEGTPPDMTSHIGEIAAEALHLIHPPKTPIVKLEESFSFDAGGVWFTGVKDVRIPGELREGIPWVRDYKTTKDWRWVKTAEEILYHPQAIIYATDEFRRGPWATVDLDWLYLKTIKPFGTPKQIAQRVGRQHIQDLFFGHVLPDAQQIELTRHADVNMLDLAPNFASCDAFGGCHLIDICKPQPRERLTGIMAQGSLLAKIRGGAAPTGPAAPPFTPPNMPAPAPAPAAPQGWTPPAPTAPAAYAPPQAAPSGPPPGWDQAFQNVPPPPNATPWQPPTEAVAPAPAPAPAAPQGWTPPPRVDAPPPAAPKNGKGKKNAEVIDDGSAPMSVTPPAAPAPQQTSTPSNEGFTLYIGCRPLNGDVTMAIDYINAAHELLCEEEKTPHFGVIDWGKGKALLQVALTRVLDSNDPLTGDVVLLRSDIEETCAAVFRQRAAKVVMGL